MERIIPERKEQDNGNQPLFSLSLSLPLVKQRKKKSLRTEKWKIEKRIASFSSNLSFSYVHYLLCRLSNPLFRQKDKIDKGLIALKSSIVLLIISQQHAKSLFHRIKNKKKSTTHSELYIFLMNFKEPHIIHVED